MEIRQDHQAACSAGASQWPQGLGAAEQSPGCDPMLSGERTWLDDPWFYLEVGSK
jgi:hypothetical protein